MSDETSTGGPFEIRHALTHTDLEEIEAIQREIWGPEDVVPTTQLRAVEHSGGQVAAAFREGRMIGFSYGFLSVPHSRGADGLGLHSHMVAVRNEGRGLGVGQALKWHQRRWAQDKGFSWISWTFDPLQAKNARLNLEHLGAVAFEYYADFYGNMTGPLGGGQNGDRLLALWQLGSQRVRRKQPRLVGTEAANGHDAVTQLPGSVLSEPEGEFWAVRPSQLAPDAEPLIATPPDQAPIVRVAVPPDVTRLLVDDPDLVRRWRAAVGVTMSRLLEGGYTTTGFRDGAYVIKRDFQPYKGET